jgi:hypothetical protein
MPVEVGGHMANAEHWRRKPPLGKFIVISIRKLRASYGNLRTVAEARATDLFPKTWLGPAAPYIRAWLAARL